MKKISKKTIVLAAMVLLLGGAVYVNWMLSGGNLNIAELVSGKKNLGDAQLVHNPSVEPSGTSSTVEDSAFTQMRLDRQKTRDDSISVLQDVTEQEALSAEEKKSAVDTLAEVAKAMEQETNIESLVKAKGFEDCMAYISEGSVTVTVKCAEELTRSQTAQIRDIVTGATGLAGEQIKIIEVS